MDNRNTWAWVVGIAVLLVVVGGLWWYLQDMPLATDVSNTPNATTASTTASKAEVSDGSAATVIDRSSQTVAQVVASLSGSSQYASYFNSTGVGATLVGTSPSSYTVFVSTDKGYGLLAPGTVTKMTAAQKKRMIQYSIISGRALDIDAFNTGDVQSLSGDTLNLHVGNAGLAQVNSSYALESYRAKNGMVYVINQPLLPPTQAH